MPSAGVRQEAGDVVLVVVVCLNLAPGNILASHGVLQWTLEMVLPGHFGGSGSLAMVCVLVYRTLCRGRAGPDTIHNLFTFSCFVNC